MTLSIYYKRICINAAIGSAALGVLLFVVYAIAGHAIVKMIYESDLLIFQQLMAGKITTSLSSYLAAMDRAVLNLAVAFILSAGVLLLMTNPLGVLCSGISLLVCSLGIFSLLDLFPALIKPLHFDVVPYFNYRVTYIPDPILGFRERPQHKAAIRGFRGWGYSPVYGIEVQPRTLLWETDEQGFRNASQPEFSDIVVIGSSFPEYGENFEDTFARRLERRLDGQTVLNFAKAGYGPVEYMKIFEQYALPKKPRYVILALNTVGDVDAHLAQRVSGKRNPGLAKRAIAFGGFLPRYRIALEQSWDIARSSIWTPVQLGFQKILGTESVHPEVAVLRFPQGTTEKMVFLDKHVAKTPTELLPLPEWRALERVIIQFKELSESHGSIPLLLYIPGATEIYSRYSTLESGAQWLAMRGAMIATGGSNGEATRTIAARVGVELIDLRPAFEEAARHGQLVYYRLDSHWNAKGREIAAEITAQALKRLGSNRRPRELKPSLPTLDPILREAKNDVRDSVMLRTLDGKINFWNPAAEQLYGWKKSEAVGRVSHDLLRTQFPEPLEQIDAELIKNGRWKGTLVHVTRDGRRVTVESRWVLERDKNRGAVVEINTPLG